ncbi:MAG: RNA polymerase sigma factor [Gemmatimonadales bacterium]|jgi:RNA polymerase sigma-70 factor (ECF subfamily)
MGSPALAVQVDGELIALYLAGDEAAASELVGRHTAALARYLAAQGAPAEELEDLSQEAFFKAFRALASFRGGASFRTWLLAIGGNVLRDGRRRWRRRQVVELTPEIRDPSGDPAQHADAGWTLERLEEGIGKLARLQREVFMMRAQQGLEYEEISAALSISEGAARVHYHHAVKRLMAWIQ